MKIVGRKREKDELMQCLMSKRPELLLFMEEGESERPILSGSSLINSSLFMLQDLRMRKQRDSFVVLRPVWWNMGIWKRRLRKIGLKLLCA